MNDKPTKSKRSEDQPSPLPARSPVEIKGDGNVVGDNSSSNVTKTEVITIGHDQVVTVPAVLAKTLQDSLDAAETLKADDQVRELLLQLTRQVAEISNAIKAKDAALIAQDVDTLTKEVTREAPRRMMYEVTLEGLKQAAKNIGEVGVPVLETAIKLLAVLHQFFP